MKLDYLAHHSHFIPAVAELGVKTFAHFNPGQTVAMRIDKITQFLNTDKLPIIFVAFENEQVIGTATLHTEDLETYTHVSPWLASVIVDPAYRNQGLGTWLVTETMKYAVELHPTWYLYTSDRESFYAKMGWKTIDNTIYQEIPGVIMRFDKR